MLNLMLQKLPVVKDSQMFTEWKKPTLESNFDIYFYNWTNPNNLETADEKLIEKPILQQIGPYRFRERREKTRIQWNDRNSTVSYREKRTYHFVPHESNGSLDDIIVTLDVPAIVSKIQLTPRKKNNNKTK